MRQRSAPQRPLHFGRAGAFFAAARAFFARSSFDFRMRFFP